MRRARATAGTGLLDAPGCPLPPAAAPGYDGRTYADPMRRAVAAALDLAFGITAVVAPLIALDRSLSALSVPDDRAGTVWLSTAAVWVSAFLLLYSPLSVSRWGATPGKRLLGMEVVRADGGGRLGYGRALARHLGNLVVNAVPVLLIAHATAVRLGEKRQGLMDKAVGSVVLRAQASRRLRCPPNSSACDRCVTRDTSVARDVCTPLSAEAGGGN